MSATVKTRQRALSGLCRAVLVSIWVASCTPTLNWREVRFDGDDFPALMPCKPEEASREVTLVLAWPPDDAHGSTPSVVDKKRQPQPQTQARPPSQELAMHLSLKACTAQDQQFSVAKMTWSSDSGPSTESLSEGQKRAVTQAWQQASLASFFKAQPLGSAINTQAVDAKALDPTPGFKGQVIRAQNPSGQQAQWLWREQANAWYQVGVYAPSSQALKVEDVQTFFESLP